MCWEGHELWDGVMGVPAGSPSLNLGCLPSFLPFHADCNVADPAMAAPQLGPGQATQLPLSESSAPGPPHGPPPGLRPDAPGGGGVPGKPPSQFVYVFTTHLANT